MTTTSDLHGWPVQHLRFSVRARKAFVRLGLWTVGHLCDTSAEQLMDCRNFGVVSLSEVRERLSDLGLHLKGDHNNGKVTP